MYDVDRLMAMRGHFVAVADWSMVRECEVALARQGVIVREQVPDEPPKKERAVSHKPPAKRQKGVAMSGLLLDGQQHWSCPNCTTTAVTRGAQNRFHDCPGLNGLSAPMVPAGTDCKVEANERGDYVNGELVRTDGEGRPIMNVITTRADGSTDCTVYAPAVSMNLGAP